MIQLKTNQLKWLKKYFFSIILILIFTIACNKKESNPSYNDNEKGSVAKKTLPKKVDRNKILYGDVYCDMTYKDVVNSDVFKKIDNDTIFKESEINNLGKDITFLEDKLSHFYLCNSTVYESAYNYLSSKIRYANKLVSIGNYKYNLNALFYKDSLFAIYLTSKTLNHSNLNDGIAEIENIISKNNGTPIKNKIRESHLKPKKQKEYDNFTRERKKHWVGLMNFTREDYIIPEPYSLFEWKLAYKTIRITHHVYEAYLTIEISKVNSINNMLNDYQNYLSKKEIDNNKTVNEESKKF